MTDDKHYARIASYFHSVWIPHQKSPGRRDDGHLGGARDGGDGRVHRGAPDRGQPPPLRRDGLRRGRLLGADDHGLPLSLVCLTLS